MCLPKTKNKVQKSLASGVDGGGRTIFGSVGGGCSSVLVVSEAAAWKQCATFRRHCCQSFLQLAWGIRGAKFSEET